MGKFISFFESFFFFFLAATWQDSCAVFSFSFSLFFFFSLLFFFFFSFFFVVEEEVNKLLTLYLSNLLSYYYKKKKKAAKKLRQTNVIFNIVTDEWKKAFLSFVYKIKSSLWVRNSTGEMPSEDIPGKTVQSNLSLYRESWKMLKGEAVVLCSCTKGFVCFVFWLAYFHLICPRHGLQHASIGCPLCWRHHARGAASPCDVHWLIPPFREHNGFWRKEQIKDFDDWQRFMPLLFLIPWLLTL